MKKLTKIFVLLLSVALVLGALMMVISADTEAEVVYKTSADEEGIKCTTDPLTDEEALAAKYVVKVVNGDVTTFGNVKWFEAKFDTYNNATNTTPDQVITTGETYYLLDNVAVNGIGQDFADSNIDKDGGNKTVTFDMNGKSLKVLSGSWLTIDEGTHNVTVTSSKEGGSIVSESDKPIIVNLRHNQTITMSNLTFEGGRLLSINTFGSYQNNATTVKFENCKLYQTGSANGFITMNDLAIGAKEKTATNPRKYVWGTMDFVGCTLSQEKYEGTGSLITPADKRKVELDSSVMTVNFSGNSVITAKAGNSVFSLNQYHVTVNVAETTVTGKLTAKYGKVVLGIGAVVNTIGGDIKGSMEYDAADVTGAKAGIYLASGTVYTEADGVYTFAKEAEKVLAVVTNDATGETIATITTPEEFATLMGVGTEYTGINSGKVTITIMNDFAYEAVDFATSGKEGVGSSFGGITNEPDGKKQAEELTLDLNGKTLKLNSGRFIFSMANNEGAVTFTMKSSVAGGKFISISSDPVFRVTRQSKKFYIDGAGENGEKNLTVEANYLFSWYKYGGSNGTGCLIDIKNANVVHTGATFIDAAASANRWEGSVNFQNCNITSTESGSKLVQIGGAFTAGTKITPVTLTDCTLDLAGTAFNFVQGSTVATVANCTFNNGTIAAGTGKVILGLGTAFKSDVAISSATYNAAVLDGTNAGIFLAEDYKFGMVDETWFRVVEADYKFPATITWYFGKNNTTSYSNYCVVDAIPKSPASIIETYKDGDVVYKFAGWALEGSSEICELTPVTADEESRAYYAVYVEYSDYAFTITNGEIVTPYESENDLTTFFTTTDMLLDGDIVTLNKNVTIAGQPGDKHTLSGSNKTVVFDLNGYTLNITDTLFALNSNTQNVTVKSSREGGVINHTGSNPLIFVKRNNHQVTIDGENITYYGHQLIWGRHYGTSNNGTGVVVNVNGGTYYQTRNSGSAFIYTYGYAHDRTTGHYYDGDINLDGVTIIQTSGVKYNEPIFSIEYHENFPVHDAINRYASKGYEVSNSVIKACTDKSIVHDMANVNAHITYTNCEIYGNVGFVGHDNYASADGKTLGDVGTGIVVINGGFYTYCSAEIKAYDAAAITKYDGSASGVYYGAEGLASFMYNGGYKVCPEADTKTIEIYWCDENGEEVFEEGIYYGGSDAFDEDGNYLGAPTSAIVPPVKVEGSVFGQMVHNGQWEFEADGTTLIAYAVMEEATSTQGAAPQYFVNAYLGTKLGVNFYIPADLALTYAYANGEEIQFSEDVCVIGEAEYRFVTVEVAANRVFNDINFEMAFAEDDMVYTFEVAVSVIEYAKTILADTEGVYTNDEDKAMVTAMLEYLRAAHAIMDGVAIPYAEAYRQFHAMIGEKGEITAAEGTEYVANEVGLTISVNLASSPEYRIKITDAAITKVEVEMSGVKYEFLPKGLDEEGNEIETLTHSFNGTGRVSDFDDTVTVTIYKGEESVSITYSFDNYVYQIVTAEGADIRVVETVTLLKAYIEAAKAYVA